MEGSSSGNRRTMAGGFPYLNMSHHHPIIISLRSHDLPSFTYINPISPTIPTEFRPTERLARVALAWRFVSVSWRKSSSSSWLQQHGWHGYPLAKIEVGKILLQQWFRTTQNGDFNISCLVKSHLVVNSTKCHKVWCFFSYQNLATTKKGHHWKIWKS